MNHIIQSIREINNSGVPEGEGSRKYLVEFQDNFYPPTYLISVANKIVNGKILDISQYQTGEASVVFLKKLGFNIVDMCSLDARILKSLCKQNKIVLTEIHSSENCSECKNVLKGILEHIYGPIEIDYCTDLGTKPEDFQDSEYYEVLKNIYESLQSFRNLDNFVTSSKLPPCDFYVKNQRKIIEFDESPHFNQLRAITLKHYPENLKLDYDKMKWLKLCEKKTMKDSKINCGDEQRAWFDTLKDFIPSLNIETPEPINSVTRLYTSDFLWCSLIPNEFSNQENPRKIE